MLLLATLYLSVFWLAVLLSDWPGRLIVAAALILALAMWRWWHRRRRTRQRHLMELFALTPAQFEEAVGHLLHDLGYRRVHRNGRAGDLTADLTAVDREGRTVVVQCKRYAPGSKVGSPDVQQFIGMCTVHHQAERGIFVTTSEFSAPARALAERHAVELFDGGRLAASLAKVHGHGSVSPVVEPG